MILLGWMLSSPVGKVLRFKVGNLAWFTGKCAENACREDECRETECDAED